MTTKTKFNIIEAIEADPGEFKLIKTISEQLLIDLTGDPLALIHLITCMMEWDYIMDMRSMKMTRKLAPGEFSNGRGRAVLTVYDLGDDRSPIRFFLNEMRYFARPVWRPPGVGPSGLPLPPSSSEKE